MSCKGKRERFGVWSSPLQAQPRGLRWTENGSNQMMVTVDIKGLNFYSYLQKFCDKLGHMSIYERGKEGVSRPYERFGLI